MNRTLELLWVKIREFFKHPVEDLRQAYPIVPGRVYNNFGYLCKAVKYSKAEQELIDTPLKDLPEVMRNEASEWGDIYNRCLLCDFQKKGVPCPLINLLKSGRAVCEDYKYIIIKNS